MTAETTILKPKRKPFLTEAARPWHHCENCDRRWKCEGHTGCTCGWWTERPAADVTTIACSRCTFSLMCSGNCDAGMGIHTKKEAKRLGWTDLQPDSFGSSWTWLGLCPECRVEEDN